MRTLGQVARTGPSRWLITDLAGLHGVTLAETRAALDGLAWFRWLYIDDDDTVVVPHRRAERPVDRAAPSLGR